MLSADEATVSKKPCAFLQRPIFEIIAMEAEHARQNYNKVKQGTFSLEYMFSLALSFFVYHFLTLCGRSYSFKKPYAFLQRQIFEIIATREHVRQNYNKVKQGTFSLEYIFLLSLYFLLSIRQCRCETKMSSLRHDIMSSRFHLSPRRNRRRNEQGR